MKAKVLFSLLTMMSTTFLWAQEPQWDKEKYPDYDPTPHVDMAAHRMMSKRMTERRAQGDIRPDHWNNALLDAFPPVMNQSAGSCGSASRIYYMFTEEMNAARGANGKLSENIYPTHFTWLLTWSKNQGKEIIAQHNGIPNSKVYGGTTYSERFGYQDCDAQDGYDYGWMQGYDKWFHAMHNRITGSANFAFPLNTEEGREMVKNYLWNHCGDDSFSAGGIVGVGVASGGNWQPIPQTTTNDALGVTGKFYVKNWGGSPDHALTIVGYDDRIEFDLDGNGIMGEADKDEIGAWIIVNSWGAGWNNGGFIYCPYAESSPTAAKKDYWQPEYYTIRRDYRPLRTLKVKMDYSHRSEIALYVGYAKDQEATKPEKEIWLRHFYYAGLCKGFTASSSNPDPKIPMLGRWADGLLHSEPMEFGYDLTDLVADVAPSTPLKFFLRIETRPWAQGTGHIYNASIIDYAVDPEGIETPFSLAAEGQLIDNQGKTTTITTIARGESLPEPRNLDITDNTLSWQAPAGTQYSVQNYLIRLNGEVIASVDGATLNSAALTAGNYTVSAVYQVNGFECESSKSAAVTKLDTATGATSNTYLQMAEGAQISVPHFNQDNTNQFTIEFWLKPDALSSTSDNFGMKSSSGKFFFKITPTKKVEVGFDGGDYGVSTGTIATDTWQHIAVTANNTNLSVFVDETPFFSFTSSTWNNTVGSTGDLLIGQTEGTLSKNKQTYAAPWTGAIDELRIWNSARTLSQLSATAKETFVLPALTKGLAYYYKMNTREAGGKTYLTDAIAGNDALITNPDKATVSQESETNKVPFAPVASTDFVLPTTVSLHKAVTLQSDCAPGTAEWAWAFTGADINAATTPTPVVIFNQAGEQTVKLTTKNINGETTEKVKTVIVNALEKPTASFTVGASEIAVGDHISFINTSTPIDDCTYEWTLTGAEQEKASSVNVAATYMTAGIYTVRLTATNAAGSHTAEQIIKVVKVAPQSAFTIRNNVAIVGEDISLIDETKYEPDAWKWTISSPIHTYWMYGQNGTLNITDPGVYSVSLETTNEKGSNTTTTKRGITVCAHDGETGLKFDDKDDEVVLASPFGDKAVKAFTFDFWLYPGLLSESCIGIGDSEETFLLRTENDGGITFYANNESVKSIGGLVVANEWHHYAITYKNDSISFYRDGIVWGWDRKLAATTSIPALKQLHLGGKEAPMNAIIDELRIWNCALTGPQVKEICNTPISDPTANTNLVLYYNFNQSSGDVIDKSASHLTGKRNNFGPDGDAWTSSRGIFYLNFSQDEDVTEKYLKNYKAPFLTGSDFVNGTERFQSLQMDTKQSPWHQENSIKNNGVTTEFYVDQAKNDFLTLTTGSEGFANEVNSLKLYQSVKLPAGIYTLYIYHDPYSRTDWAPAHIKTVVSKGEGLPDWEDLDTQALASAYNGLGCQFTLTETTRVNLGLVSIQKNQVCNAIQEFVLLSSGFTIYDANGEIVTDKVESTTSATSTIQAQGGLNCLRITATKPQFVNVYSIDGKRVWGSFVDNQATIRIPSGIYLVAGKKIAVK